ncbi:S8 family serine peptidase [Pedobacter sp. L105]|uniref:S8 family serine peptidase n=1 Tax=Pedobacter sp. L105 TaxID=1641871 RepID=UPI00131E6775|nr:S8 family serine peptidase [Pedobacter sp. L105]
MKKQHTDNYILLPVTQTRISPVDSPRVADFLSKLQPTNQRPAFVNLNVRSKLKQPEDEILVEVLDSIHDEGAKLIRISKEELPTFRFSYPGLRIIPEKFYRPAVCSKEKIKIQVQTKQTRLSTPLCIKVTDQKNQGIADISVVVFTDFFSGKGASGITDKNGVVNLKMNSMQAERIYIYPDHSYWGYFKKNIKLNSNMQIKLQPIALNYKDALRYFYDTAKLPPINHKVKIGVIDTGIGPHKDLKVSGGKNLVRGENEADYYDNGEGHGTHVGGIISAAGNIYGVAAGAEIMSYRVFPKGEGASNFDIMKAINQAIEDQCDLLNMSLGEALDDEAITSYIREAFNTGILCFAANGNDNRSPVNFPAAYSLSIGVSAMGRKGTFPTNSIETSTIDAPYGTDKNNFIADFSNVGTETDLTAPGVGIISTYPNDKYAVMDGTSMACPAAAGMAARILASYPEILDLPRNQARSEEMVKILSMHIKILGFGANFEGKGMLYQNDEIHS